MWPTAKYIAVLNIWFSCLILYAGSAATKRTQSLTFTPPKNDIRFSNNDYFIMILSYLINLHVFETILT